MSTIFDLHKISSEDQRVRVFSLPLGINNGSIVFDSLELTLFRWIYFLGIVFSFLICSFGISADATETPLPYIDQLITYKNTPEDERPFVSPLANALVGQGVYPNDIVKYLQNLPTYLGPELEASDAFKGLMTGDIDEFSGFSVEVVLAALFYSTNKSSVFESTLTDSAMASFKTLNQGDGLVESANSSFGSSNPSVEKSYRHLINLILSYKESLLRFEDHGIFSDDKILEFEYENKRFGYEVARIFFSSMIGDTIRRILLEEESGQTISLARFEANGGVELEKLHQSIDQYISVGLKLINLVHSVGLASGKDPSSWDEIDTLVAEKMKNTLFFTPRESLGSSPSIMGLSASSKTLRTRLLDIANDIAQVVFLPISILMGVESAPWVSDLIQSVQAPLMLCSLAGGVAWKFRSNCKKQRMKDLEPLNVFAHRSGDSVHHRLLNEVFFHGVDQPGNVQSMARTRSLCATILTLKKYQDRN